MRCARSLWRSFFPAVMSVAAVALIAHTAFASVVFTGDVTPDDSSNWSSSTTAKIGNNVGDGTVLINDGSTIASNYVYLGYNSGISGTATMDGGTWNHGRYYVVGLYGYGQLDIQNGGVVSGGSTSYGRIGAGSGGTGVATIDGSGSLWSVGTMNVGYSSGAGTLNITNSGLVTASVSTIVKSESTLNFNGGTLSTPTLTGASSDLTGTGTITGLVGIDSDVNLTFDNASSTVGSIGGSIDVEIDLSSASGVLGIGYTSGTGTLAVQNGAHIYSTNGNLGCHSAATGIATVDGSNSVWSVTGNLALGNSGGTGTLNVSNGGLVDVGGITTVTLGTINFNGGTLSTTYLQSTGLPVTGTGTVAGLKGICGNVDLVFDGASSTSTTLNESVVGQFDLSSAAAKLGVGYYGGSGTIQVLNGAQIYSTAGYVGESSGSSGTATVDGSGSSWTISGGDLYVALNGDGVLNVTNGGAVSTTRSLNLGSNGNATVEIGNGASVSVNNSTYLRTGNASIHFSGGTLTTTDLTAGAATLTGTGSITGVKSINSDVNLVFDNTSLGTGTINSNIDVSVDFSSAIGSLGLGYDSTGTLNVQNGAAIYAASSILGYNSSSAGTATVDGTGSSWKINGVLQVGLYGDGTLNITNGGTVECGNTSPYGVVSVGKYSDSSSTVTVEDAGSVWSVLGSLHLGSQGDGSLYINNGGSVSVGDTTYFANSVGATGKLFFGGTGGTLSTKTLYTSFSHADAAVSGAGTINTRGLVSDLDITFDGSGSASKTVNSATLNVNLSDSSNVGILGTGYMDEGSVTIMNGANVYSRGGDLGTRLGTSGTVTITDPGSQWTVNSATLVVGNLGDGQVEVLNGGSLVTNHWETYIGSQTGSWGMVTVSGSNSTWTTHDNLVSVGHTSYGTVKVLNGGSIVNTANTLFGVGMYNNSVGLLTVDGSGSDLTTYILKVAYLGDGTLNLTNGASINTTRGYIADGSNGYGTATVSGANSTWNNSDYLYVGSNGTGILTIANGGAVNVGGATWVGRVSGKGSSISFSNGTLTTQSLYASPSNSSSALTGTGVINTQGLVSDVALAIDSTGVKTFTINSSVAVNLDTSDSSNRGDLGAGYWGNGTLNISNGATVYSANGYLAYYSTAAGTATVTGANTLWDLSGTLYVGKAGYISNVMNVNSGATVAAAAITVSNASELNIDGGTLKANAASTSWLQASSSGSVCLQGGGATIDTNGYNVRISGQLQAGSVTTGGGLTKTGDGALTLVGANTYTGLTAVNGGTLELGEAAQSVVLTGAGADVQNGTLVFDYSSSAPDIQTLLTASFTGGTAAWTTGQFLSTTSDSSHGLGWADDGSSQVTVMYTLYGDSNLDGSVNGTDLNAVLSYYNQSGEVWANGDFNYDGSVNGTDLNTVLSNYNQSLSASTAAVPEPSTMLLAAVALLGLLAWRKRK